MNQELDIHQANPAEREEIYRQSYDIWGRKELSVDNHVAWRMSHSQHNHGTWYVGCIEGKVVASLAAYSNTYGYKGEQIGGIAIASVFTHPEFRGQGIAPKMLAHTEEQARTAGGQISILFSDVGTEYYANMGYIACESWQGTHRMATDDDFATSAFQMNEFDALSESKTLAGLYERATCQDVFQVIRSPKYWQAFLGKDRDDRFFWLEDDNSAAEGYVRLRIAGDQILIRDWAWPCEWSRDKQTAALNTIINWGKKKGIETVTCWAPPSGPFDDAFQLHQREVEITMMKPLSDFAVIDDSIRHSAARLREIDHV